MNRLVLGLAVMALAACQHGSGAPGSGAGVVLSDADFVLPGSFSEQTTLADLESRYGAANVKVTSEPDYDGGERPLVLLFPDDPTRRAEVRFHGADPFDILASITVTEPTSRWRGKRGVRVGSSLADLRAKNGRAFFLVGFDEAGRGEVRDWWDVGELDVAEGERLYFAVELRLRDGAAPGAFPRSEGMTSSDDPLFPKLGELAEVSAISAWSSLDDEWSRAPRVRPSSLALRRP